VDERASARQHRVVATAGHVDHGKSSLIVALTGMDPDRWAEEKRRGLTIDLGYAWCTLPSGREIGFVDVPGHERFITNMLAGVGPAPLVLFVVAADEGWKPQSEEHLEILDVLGIVGGVVALTKIDLIDPEDRAGAIGRVGDRLAGSALATAPIVAVSARTNEGLDELRAGLDRMIDDAPPIEPARTRSFVDRVFTITGAGTVATGTLHGGCLEVGQEVGVYPEGMRARVRSLQTHQRTESTVCAVSRVAANLTGIDRTDVRRGDVIGEPGAWPVTTAFDAQLRPVRGLDHPVTSRGAFKIYAGAAEVDATLRFLGGATRLEPGGEAFVRVKVNRPMTLDVFERFVVREAGRRETVAGGQVLDVAAPPRAGADRANRLRRRAAARRSELPGLMALERGAVTAADAVLMTGASSPPTPDVDGWLLRPGLTETARDALVGQLAGYHLEHPLEEGAPLQRCRETVAATLRHEQAPEDNDLIEGLLRSFASAGAIAMSATTVRSSEHRVSLDSHNDDVARLVAAIGGDHEATPPTQKELEAFGLTRAVIDAAARAGLVVRISPEIVLTPAFVDRARDVVAGAPAGITVSAFRETLGTSRKYAVPLLEHFDRTGVTRREGDLRFAP
jgi:selenocysteine-specific elongation factor